MSEFVCESLGKQQARKSFDCGVTILNQYLVKIASQDVKRKAAAVFVMTPKTDPLRIVGYDSLCSTLIELTALPSDL